MIVLSKNPTVEVVVINYKRPENIAPVLRRFREQSYPCIVTLIDQSGGLDLETLKLAHRVYSTRENYGAYNRYIFMGNYHCDFTYFHDNDMLPGIDLIKYFITHVKDRPSGALFGQLGRLCTYGYSIKDTWKQEDSWNLVSLVNRGYFLKTKYLQVLLKFSRYFNHPVFEDDILLAWSIYTYTNKFIYITPKPVSPSEMMNEQELPAPHACCDRPGHYEVRGRFWKQCEEISRRVKSKRRKNQRKKENYRES